MATDRQPMVIDKSTGEILSGAEPLTCGEAINREHRLACETAGTAIEHIIRCGELLIDQKAHLQHGQFQGWVEENCEFSLRQAQRYMLVVTKKNDTRVVFNSLRQALGYDNPKQPAERQPHPSESIDGCEVSDLESLAETFGCIYADPPWLYGNQATRAATGNHYGGMTIAEICDLPIATLAADNAHLHLWTTNGFLQDAFRVIDAWGFTYKSCFVWVKPQMGIGNYWRVSHEFLLLGVRGSCSFQDKSLMSWASLDRTKHSAKPDQIRHMIERASPGPRLELFARRLSPGWLAWGNEIERAVFQRAVNE